tara:strand:+ start:175 stop:537 length:363 start_codon:yes stop_codon:yes gene_type:complete
MELTNALFLFLSGAISHAFLSRLLGINAKVRVYRTALISCLGITKFAGDHAERFLTMTCEDENEKPYIKNAVEYWQNLSLVSLKNSTPPEIWASLGVKDWRSASKLVENMERFTQEHNNE